MLPPCKLQYHKVVSFATGYLAVSGCLFQLKMPVEVWPNRVYVRFSLLYLFEDASCCGFFHFCLDTKVEQKIKAA
jgi:hypothetical protein